MFLIRRWLNYIKGLITHLETELGIIEPEPPSTKNTLVEKYIPIYECLLCGKVWHGYKVDARCTIPLDVAHIEGCLLGHEGRSNLRGIKVVKEVANGVKRQNQTI